MITLRDKIQCPVIALLLVLLFVFLLGQSENIFVKAASEWDVSHGASSRCFAEVEQDVEYKSPVSLRVVGKIQTDILLRHPYSANASQPELIAIVSGYTAHVNPVGPSIVRFATSQRTTEELIDLVRYTMHSPIDRLYLNTLDISLSGNILRADLVQADTDEYYLFIQRVIEDGNLDFSRIQVSNEALVLKDRVVLQGSDTTALTAEPGELNRAGSIVHYIQVVRCDDTTDAGICTTNRIHVRTMKWRTNTWIPLRGFSSHKSGLDMIVFDMFASPKNNHPDYQMEYFVIYNATHIMSFNRNTGSLRCSIFYHSDLYDSLRPSNTYPRVHMHPQSSTFVIVSNCLLHYYFNGSNGNITFLKESCSSLYNKTDTENFVGSMDATIGSITPDNKAILFTVSPVDIDCFIMVYDLYTMVLSESSLPCSNSFSQSNYHLLSGHFNAMVSLGNNSYFAIHSTGTMVDLSADSQYNKLAENRRFPTRATVLHYITEPFSEYMRDYVTSLLVYDVEIDKVTLLIQSHKYRSSRLWFLDLTVNTQRSEIEKLNFGHELSIQPILADHSIYQVPLIAHAPFRFKSTPKMAHVMYVASSSEYERNNAVATLYTYNPDKRELAWSKDFLFTEIIGYRPPSLDFKYFVSHVHEMIFAISETIDSTAVIWGTTVEDAPVESQRIIFDANSTVYLDELTLISFRCFSDADETLAVFSATSSSSKTLLLVQIDVFTGEIKGIIETGVSKYRTITAIPRKGVIYVVGYRPVVPTVYDKSVLDTSIKIIMIPLSFNENEKKVVDLRYEKRVNIVLTGCFFDSDTTIYVSAESTGGKTALFQIFIGGSNPYLKQMFFIGDRTGALTRALFSKQKKMIFFFTEGTGDYLMEAPVIHVMKIPFRRQFKNKCLRAILGSVVSFISLIFVLGIVLVLVTRYKLAKVSHMYKKMEEKWIDHNSLEYSTKKWLIEYNDLKLERVLGKGISGKVFEGRWGRSKVAIKLMHDVESDSQFIEEAHTLIQLRHMNVLLFLGICIHDDNRYLVTELMERGSLDSILNLQYEVDLSSKLAILRDISEGMVYLHSKKPPIIHRDLKPQNILLDQYMRPKIGDFGVSKCGESVSGFAGTPQYCAPEILSGQNEYTTSCDVYSFGILMYHLLTESVPYGAYTIWNGIPQQRVINGERPQLDFLIDNIELPDLDSQSQKPLIKFMIDEQKLHRWCKKVGYQSSFAVQRYTELMVECWQNHPMDRPEFIDIHGQLQEILRELTF